MYAHRKVVEYFWIGVFVIGLVASIMFLIPFALSFEPGKSDWLYGALIVSAAYLICYIYLLVDLRKTSKKEKTTTYKREISYIDRALKDVLVLNGNYDRKDIQLKTLLSTILHSLDAGLTEKQINKRLKDRGSDLHFEGPEQIKNIRTKNIGTHIYLKVQNIEVISLKIF